MPLFILDVIVSWERMLKLSHQIFTVYPPNFVIKIKEIKTADVIIEDNVFIGNHVSILKGTKIGTNSVIGSGSVVTGIIPANVIAAGNPAQIIRTIKMLNFGFA